MKPKEYKINDVDQLRFEIVRLKLLQKAQEAELGEQYRLLKNKVEAPVRFVNQLLSWVPGVDVAKGLLANSSLGKNGKKDWVSKLFSLTSTALLNRLFLRRAGLIKRLVVSAVTQEAAGMMNKERVSGLIKSLADYIRPAKNKNRPKDHEDPLEQPAHSPDFGVPPDSEAS